MDFKLSSIIQTCSTILLVILLSSCSNVIDDIVAGVKFLSTEIPLPNKMIMIDDNQILLQECDFRKPTIISFYDLDDCNACVINRLHENERLYEFAEEYPGAINVMIVLTPNSDYEEMIRTITMRQFQFPIYLDFDKHFHNQNVMPKNPKFHVFLIDNRGVPLVAGDPTLNNRIKSLYLKEIL